MDIPEWIEEVFYSYLTSELTYVDGKDPLTVAVLPLYDADKGSIVITTTPAFYHKVECIKRNPKVALLYSNSKYSGLNQNPLLLLQGEAIVLEKDLDENSKYVEALISSQRECWKKVALHKMLKEMLSTLGKIMMDWYIIRIIIEIRPHRILAWRSGDFEKEPEILEVN